MRKFSGYKRRPSNEYLRSVFVRPGDVGRRAAAVGGLARDAPWRSSHALSSQTWARRGNRARTRLSPFGVMRTPAEKPEKRFAHHSFQGKQVMARLKFRAAK